jgi:hypothetical protein
VCQWLAALFDLDAPGPTTALNAGRWACDPRRASSRRHAAGPVPLPLRGGAWWHRTPSRGKGSPGPPSPVEGAWPVMVRSSHVAASDPQGSPGRGGNPRALLPSWVHRGPGPLRARGGSGDRGPSCQARVVCHVTQKARGRLLVYETPGAWTP